MVGFLLIVVGSLVRTPGERVRGEIFRLLINYVWTKKTAVK